MAPRYVMCALVLCMHASSVVSFLSPNIAGGFALKSHAGTALCPRAAMSSRFLGSFQASGRIQHPHNLALRTKMKYEDDDASIEEDTPALEVEQDPLEMDERAVHVPADVGAAEASIFAAMGLIPELCDALREMHIVTPTAIQQASVPTTLAGESVLLCAETGSGKSLAFLLPLVHRLKYDEATRGIKSRAKRPRAVVLAPTRELGNQLLQVAKGLSKHARFSSVGCFGGSSLAQQAKRLNQPVDLIVATPGRLVELVKEGHVSLGDVRFVVADEADTMASQAAAAAKEGYKKAAVVRAKLQASAEEAGTEERAAIEQQLKMLRGPFHPEDKGNVQCILAAATVQESVKAILGSTFPKYREVKTETAHRISDAIFQEFISVTAGDRAMRLLEVLDRGMRMNKNAWAVPRATGGGEEREGIIIFCNTKDSAMFVAKLLRENEMEVAEGHGWVAQHERIREVATDVVARGIDTVNVAHVINFDFPLNPVDYLHRVGRTGRGGGSGRVTNLVGKRDYTLAMAIERASKLGQPIEGLSSKRADYVQGKPGLLKSDSPTTPKYDRDGPRPSATRARPGAGSRGGATRRSKPKPKDTSAKSMKRAPKSRR